MVMYSLKKYSLDWDKLLTLSSKILFKNLIDFSALHTSQLYNVSAFWDMMELSDDRVC